MISLKHITEAELRQYYLLEGKISGRDKQINMLNGVQQEYVASRIHDFIIWNDPPNKSKHELYIKENLPKMEIKYDTIKKEQEQVKKKQEQELEQELVNRKKIIHKLHRGTSENIRNRVLQRFSISENDYDNEINEMGWNFAFVQQQREIKKANEICSNFNRKN